MKTLLASFTLVMMSTFGIAQCTLSGLDSFYCSSDSISALTVSCGSNPIIFGPGINSNGDFNPANAGLGSKTIFVLDSNTAYNIDQSGSFDTIGVNGSATSLTMTDDQTIQNLPIGFAFRFFDKIYTTFGISSNGFMYFGNDGSTAYNSVAIPNGSIPNNYIAFAWEDLNPSLGSAEINYYTVGTAPERRLIMNFINVQHFGGNYPVTSQVQLWEGCGRIEIHTTSMPSDGGGHVMGIESQNGTYGHAVPGRNNTNWSASNDFVAFIPECGDTFSTFISDGPSISLSIDTLECLDGEDGSMTVSATGNGPFEVLWSTGDSAASIYELVIGTYMVTVTDANGCEAALSQNMPSPPLIDVSFTDQPSYCESDENGALWISTSGGVLPHTHVWENGSSADTISNLSSGNYPVTVTDANGCTKAFEGMVGYQHEDPDVDLGDDKSLCPGQNTVLIAPPGYESYLWSDSSNANAIVINQGGEYAVTVTSDQGCITTDTIVVAENIPIQVDLGPDRSGVGPIILDAGDYYQSYFWNTGSTSQTLSVSITGTYAVSAQDTLGCISDDSVYVKVWTAGIGSPSEEAFLVYPNPTNGLITLTNTDPGTLRWKLMSTQGLVLMHETMIISDHGMVEIDLGSIPSGTYIIQLHQGTRMSSKVITKI